MMTVRVLHVNENDARGGAARAAYRLHRALRSTGVESRMLVARKLSDDTDVRPLARPTLDRRLSPVLEQLGLPDTFSVASFRIAADPWFIASDVLQLHNLQAGRFGFAALPLLTHRRPTVWLLHDMWALTGHVPYAED